EAEYSTWVSTVKDKRCLEPEGRFQPRCHRAGKVKPAYGETGCGYTVRVLGNIYMCKC
ncbi:hypothetical protein KIPB_016021, partial [Kipferlia bialata]